MQVPVASFHPEFEPVSHSTKRVVNDLHESTAELRLVCAGDLARELGRFHSSCRVDFVVSHPFHIEREMDGARSFLTPSVKMP